MADNSPEFSVGDLVWVFRCKSSAAGGKDAADNFCQKIHHIPWPGRILEPPNNISTWALNRKKYWVYFFGYKHFAWVAKHKVEAFTDDGKYSNEVSDVFYKKAIAAAIKYKSGHGESDSESSLEENVEAAFPSNVVTHVQRVHNVSQTCNVDPDLSCDNRRQQSPTDPDRSCDNRRLRYPTIPDFCDDPVMVPYPYCEVELLKVRPCRKRNGAMYVVCKVPTEFEISREKNKDPETAIVVVEPLDPVVRSATRIKLERCSSPRRSTKRKSHSEHEVCKRARTDCITAILAKIPQHIFGIVGCGAVGTQISLLLRRIGQPVYVHDEIRKRCETVEGVGAVYLSKPSDIYSACDFTLCTLPSIEAAKQMLFSSSNGVYPHVMRNKGVVIFTPMDTQSSTDIAEIFEMHGGRYLESPLFYPALHSSSVDKMYIIAAGELSFFNELKYHLYAISPFTFHVGPAGTGTQICNILTSLLGTIVACFSEAIQLGVKFGLFQDKQCIGDFCNIIHSSMMGNLINLQEADVENFMNRKWPLKASTTHVQRALDAVITQAHEAGLNMPIMTAANEAIIQEQAIIQKLACIESV